MLNRVSLYFEPYGYKHLVRQSAVLTVEGKQEFIVFTPKVAGSSIKRQLLEQCGAYKDGTDIHRLLRSVNKGFGELGFARFNALIRNGDLAPFCLIRNPLDRFYSGFNDKILNFYKTKSPSARGYIEKQCSRMFAPNVLARWVEDRDKPEISTDLSRKMFAAYCDYVLRTPCRLLDPHFASQTVNLRLDLFVRARLYRLESFDAYCEALGLDMDQKRHENYSVKKLDLDAAEMNRLEDGIRKRFAGDIVVYEELCR